uniref:Uncharacterized protein n=1 Tax=Manihot esculenta TaxID=3983 RepID=A0A2C9V441_MANES
MTICLICGHLTICLEHAFFFVIALCQFNMIFPNLHNVETHKQWCKNTISQILHFGFGMAMPPAPRW